MNGGNSGNNGGGNSGNNGGGNSGNNGGGNSGDSDGGFEFKPIYLLGIAAVAVIIFLIVRANSKGGSNGSNVGTVALEQTSAAPIDGSATRIIGTLANGRAVIASGEEVYVITLPQNTNLK